MSKSGSQLRDEGIHCAIENAERANKGWSIKISGEFRTWVGRQGKVFAVEDFRKYIALHKPELMPASSNAWGHLGMVGVNRGFMQRAGSRQAKSKETHGHEIKTYVRKAA